jgi:hypothetical protein
MFTMGEWNIKFSKNWKLGKILIELAIFFSLKLDFDQKIKLLWTNSYFYDIVFLSTQ